MILRITRDRVTTDIGSRPADGPGFNDTAVNRSSAGWPAEETERVVTTAIAQSDLVTDTDPDGTIRFVPAEPDALRALATAEAERDHPDRTLIARINQALAECARGDES